MSFDRCEFELLGFSDLDPTSFYSSIFDPIELPISDLDDVLALKNPKSLDSSIDQILMNLEADCESQHSQSNELTSLELIVNEDKSTESLGLDILSTEFEFDFVEPSSNATSIMSFSADAEHLINYNLPLSCEPRKLCLSDSDSPLSFTKGADYLLPLTPSSLIDKSDLFSSSCIGEKQMEAPASKENLVAKKVNNSTAIKSSPKCSDCTGERLRSLKRKHQEDDYFYETEPRNFSPVDVRSVPKRFKSSGFITLEISATQCLDVDLNYHSYTGKISEVILNHDLTNFAFKEHKFPDRQSQIVERVVKYYQGELNETHVGTHEGLISFESGVLQRKIYIRDISEITNMVSNVIYEASSKFNVNTPYEPQYFRYELDENQNIVGESKCGLCTFCPQVRFYPFKNSSYLSHMTLMHGVFANNYIVPEGLYVGRYRLNRTSYSRKKNVIDAIQCPSCFHVTPIKCWRSKTNPLLSYFRHFKKQHQKDTRTFIDSVVDPVNYKQLS